MGIRMPGAQKLSSRNLVNKEPLSSSLKHNDQQLLKLLRLASEDKDREEGEPLTDELSPGASAIEAQKKAANLRELVGEMAEEAREMSAALEEEQRRSMNWGDKSSEEFDFLSNQAQEYMTLIGMCASCRGAATSRNLLALEGEWGAAKTSDRAESHNRRKTLVAKTFCKSCIKPYTPGVGTIRPTEIIGEVE